MQPTFTRMTNGVVQYGRGRECGRRVLVGAQNVIDDDAKPQPFAPSRSDTVARPIGFGNPH
jgi:hypothetical protein